MPGDATRRYPPELQERAVRRSARSVPITTRSGRRWPRSLTCSGLGLQLNREGIPVARCTVARLMRQHGLVGARRGKVRRPCHRRPDRQPAR